MLQITSKSLEVTAPIRERIESRFAKLARRDVQFINPRVVITQEKEFFQIEAKIGIPNGELFATARNATLYAAITELGQKIEKQLNKEVKKPESQRRQGLIKPEEEASTVDDAELDRYEEEETVV